MQVYIAYFLILLAVVLFVILFRLLFLPPKNVTKELFHEGLRTENNGDYEAAIASYESALLESGRSNYLGSSLKNRITAKLKVLYTLTNNRKNAGSAR